MRPKELELRTDELVQVIRPVYSLSDSGEYWAETLSQHLREHLRLLQATTDLALRLRVVGTKLMALAAPYVDGVLLESTEEAREQFNKI